MPFVAVGDGTAGGAGFLFDRDVDFAAVAVGGGGDDFLDRAGRFADTDDVCDVVVAVAVEFELEADGVVGVGGGGARFGCGQVPEADGPGCVWQLGAVDLFEPAVL